MAWFRHFHQWWFRVWSCIKQRDEHRIDQIISWSPCDSLFLTCSHSFICDARLNCWINILDNLPIIWWHFRRRLRQPNPLSDTDVNRRLRSECNDYYSIGNHAVKRVVYFLNHINQQVGRWVLINHHKWREWWLIRTHRPTSWLMWFRKYTTSLWCDFWLIQHQNLDHYAFD